eukprot:GHVP01060408.1.p1 GENE.GHVP01060408.1~~GHVP01060408.1.p1  ORF type:complete len:803 (+),score=156.33 GHVP01060408.1:1-2409(+)
MSLYQRILRGTMEDLRFLHFHPFHVMEEKRISHIDFQRSRSIRRTNHANLFSSSQRFLTLVCVLSCLGISAAFFGPIWAKSGKQSRNNKIDHSIIPNVPQLEPKKSWKKSDKKNSGPFATNAQSASKQTRNKSKKDNSGKTKQVGKSSKNYASGDPTARNQSALKPQTKKSGGRIGGRYAGKHLPLILNSSDFAKKSTIEETDQSPSSAADKLALTAQPIKSRKKSGETKATPKHLGKKAVKEEIGGRASGKDLPLVPNSKDAAKVEYFDMTEESRKEESDQSPSSARGDPAADKLALKPKPKKSEKNSGQIEAPLAAKHLPPQKPNSYDTAKVCKTKIQFQDPTASLKPSEKRSLSSPTDNQSALKPQKEKSDQSATAVTKLAETPVTEEIKDQEIRKDFPLKPNSRDIAKKSTVEESDQSFSSALGDPAADKLAPKSQPIKSRKKSGETTPKHLGKNAVKEEIGDRSTGKDLPPKSQPEKARMNALNNQPTVLPTKLKEEIVNPASGTSSTLAKKPLREKTVDRATGEDLPSKPDTAKVEDSDLTEESRKESERSTCSDLEYCSRPLENPSYVNPASGFQYKLGKHVVQNYEGKQWKNYSTAVGLSCSLGALCHLLRIDPVWTSRLGEKNSPLDSQLSTLLGKVLNYNTGVSLGALEQVNEEALEILRPGILEKLGNFVNPCDILDVLDDMYHKVKTANPDEIQRELEFCERCRYFYSTVTTPNSGLAPFWSTFYLQETKSRALDFSVRGCLLKPKNYKKGDLPKTFQIRGQHECVLRCEKYKYRLSASHSIQNIFDDDG